MGYTAGWNMAGYLPETDPEEFDTLEDAVAYLRDTVDRWIDQDADMARADSGREPLTAEDIVGPDGDGWYQDYHLWCVPSE